MERSAIGGSAYGGHCLVAAPARLGEALLRSLGEGVDSSASRERRRKKWVRAVMRPPSGRKRGSHVRGVERTEAGGMAVSWLSNGDGGLTMMPNNRRCQI